MRRDGNWLGLASFVAALAGAGVGACTDPDVDGQVFECSPDETCASGYTCVAGLCQPDGWSPDTTDGDTATGDAVADVVADAGDTAVLDTAPEDTTTEDTGPDDTAVADTAVEDTSDADGDAGGDGCSTEICDGLDNDCDGDTDEGFTWEGIAVGEVCDGTGACGDGVVECVSGRTDAATCSTNPDGTEAEGSDEICDALDNDCDGELNEGLGVADSPCKKLGVCATGLADVVATCDAEGVWRCDYGDVAGYEDEVELSCDGFDNDCDGGTDDEFAVGTGCDGDDANDCLDGVVKCDPGDTSLTYCDESGAQAQVEVCDGFDNDCDGQTDEDFKAGDDNTVTLTAAAYAGDDGKTLGMSCGAGACVASGMGTVSCYPPDPTRLACVTPVTPSVEVCDDVDNNCNGVVDEVFLPGGTVSYDGGPYGADAGRGKGESCGVGECAGGTVVCGSTTALTCSTSAEASAEVCDDADNDCNGVVDDPFLPGGTISYDGGPHDADAGLGKGETCGTGWCAGGEVVCASTVALTCSALASLSYETCDGDDNDCDGDVDEGFNHDGDAHVDCEDGDDDDDGVVDDADSCPLGELGWTSNPDTDYDSDGCHDGGEDTDDDNDGVADNVDECPIGELDWPTGDDMDGDGCRDYTEDPCIDLDQDGWGRAGYEQVGCANMGDDCDDVGVDDMDGDNVCADGGTPCMDGQTFACSDNCPDDANPDQADSDGDGIGDACDTD